jgi:hypothetical protein
VDTPGGLSSRSTLKDRFRNFWRRSSGCRSRRQSHPGGPVDDRRLSFSFPRKNGLAMSSFPFQSFSKGDDDTAAPKPLPRGEVVGSTRFWHLGIRVA